MITTDWISAKSYIVGEQFFYTLNNSIRKYTNSNSLSISVNIVSDRVMKKMNKLWRQINKTTDVLAFSYNEDSSLIVGDKIYDGEIIISFQQAKKQAIGHSLRQEVDTLYIHGVLHILGYDHANKKDKELMYNFQDKILKHWEKNYGR